MKKVLAISSVLVGVVFLAGCGQQPVSQTQPTTPASVAQTPISSVEKNKIDNFLLSNSDLPEGYKLSNKEMPVSYQASSLYNEINQYSKILKINSIDKKFQSLESSTDSGTVYYLLFDGAADKAKSFTEGLVWGSTNSNKYHPDEILVNDNLLVVLSFKKDSKIKEIIKTKITKQLSNQSVTTQQVNNLQQKNIPISNHGTLILNMPKSWTSSVDQSENNLPPTITINTPDKNLKILITPLWNAKDSTKPIDLIEIKRLVENDGNEIVKSALEKNYTLRELNGVRAKGYYFDLLTDKKYEKIAPPAGEYKYAMRAGARIDKLLLSVTFLSSSKESEQITQGLEMLKNLEHTK